ncbi:MAG: mercuric transport protein MerTP [Bacteroidetes bacterium]|nr:MAG: mercuric transport protein MerTP [Bacteroidota bacterium]
MQANKSSKGLVGAGLLTAIAASLCCITPVLALVAGASGMAATFSWLEPLRPYFIGLTVLVLGFAWYQKLRPRTAEEIACECEEDGKEPFLQSKKFLGIVTVVAGLLLAFPWYSSIFYPNHEQKVVVVDAANVEQLNMQVNGMTCGSCEEHVKDALYKLDGVIEAQASYSDGTAMVKYDKTKVSQEKVIEAVNETGYKVAKSELISQKNPKN